MIITATRKDLEKALENINGKYQNNIKFKRLDQIGKKVHFTLTVESSKGPGHKTSASYFHRGRKVAAACWHVHGDFFDALLAVNPEARINTMGKIWIDKNGGNWQDWNVGPPVSPIMISACCDCGKDKKQ